MWLALARAHTGCSNRIAKRLPGITQSPAVKCLEPRVHGPFEALDRCPLVHGVRQRRRPLAIARARRPWRCTQAVSAIVVSCGEQGSHGVAVAGVVIGGFPGHDQVPSWLRGGYAFRLPRREHNATLSALRQTGAVAKLVRLVSPTRRDQNHSWVAYLFPIHAIQRGPPPEVSSGAALPYGLERLRISRVLASTWMQGDAVTKPRRIGSVHCPGIAAKASPSLA